jgi:hypothetical protein
MSNKKESVDKNTFDFELNELLSALPPIIRERILMSESATGDLRKFVTSTTSSD